LESMFVLQDGLYLPTDRSRGPWDPAFLHGGAAAALLVHGVEAERKDPAMVISKIAIDLMRPVPAAPLALSAQVVRDGKRVRYVDVTLRSMDQLIARAAAVMLRPSALYAGQEAAPAQAVIKGWETLPLRPWMDRPDERKLFHTGLEIRLLREPYTGEPSLVWARVPYDFLPGRPLTPTVHAAALSDLTNGIGMMSVPGALRPFINPEITLYLVREPVGGWFCLEGVGRAEHAGLATSNVNFHDAGGLVGHACLASMANALTKEPGSVRGGRG